MRRKSLFFSLVGLILAPAILAGQDFSEREARCYQTAKEKIKDAFAESRLASCGYQFGLSRPKTISLGYKDLNRLFRLLNPEENFDVVGFYDPNTQVIYYQTDRWDTLIHEYVHYLNNGGNTGKRVDRVCLDELAANGIGDTWKLERKVNYLEEQIKSLEARLRAVQRAP